MTWGGVITALALGAGMLATFRAGKRAGLPGALFLRYFLWAVPVGFVGARLYYALGSYGVFSGQPELLLQIGKGGFSLYGALLSCWLLAAILHKGEQRRLFLDCLAPGAALAIALGKLAGYFTQEGYGPPVRGTFPLAVYVQSEQEWFLALFFFESLLCFALFFLTLKPAARAGGKAILFFTLFAAGRAFLESLRENALRIWFVRLSEAVGGILLLALFIFFLTGIVKKTRFGAPHALAALLFTSFFAGAFLAEFYMGSESRTRNLLWLAVCIAGMAGMVLGAYRRFVLLQKPKKQTRRYAVREQL